ncbi:MAG TPA: peroxiredoxin [Longimicrobium sp.]|jgi:peroxiredoxin
MPLQIGDQAPDVTLPAHDNQQVSLGSLYGGQATVVVFFPLAFTSTCTEELCTFRDDLAVYNGLGAQVAAISVDSPYVLDRFRKELGADYLFLSDFNREASRAFGVLREAPVGPGLRDVSDRSVFVVNPDRTVRYVWHSSNPSLLPPFDEIREALAA